MKKKIKYGRFTSGKGEPGEWTLVTRLLVITTGLGIFRGLKGAQKLTSLSLVSSKITFY